MQNKYLDKKIGLIDIDEKYVKKLNDNKIYLVKELFILNRKKLKQIGFADTEINKIIIKLQLIGLDLNGKKY